MVGRHRTARLADAAGHGMRFSRVDAMQRGAGQQRRVGRVRAGWHGWRVRRGTECDFRASMPCNVERASTAGIAGVRTRMARMAVVRGTKYEIRASMPCNVERASSAGMAGVQTGWRGWRLSGARNTKFAQRPYGAGRGPRGRGWSGFGREARRAVVAGHECEIRARTLRSGVRTGGGGMRWMFWRPRNAIFAQRPPGCVFDKSCSYPVQLSGDRCGWGARWCQRRRQGAFSTNPAATLCDCQGTTILVLGERPPNPGPLRGPSPHGEGGEEMRD
jgi:hypothetical protein